MRAGELMLEIKSTSEINYKLLWKDLGAGYKGFALQQKMRNYQPEGFLHQKVGLELFEAYIPDAWHKRVPPVNLVNGNLLIWSNTKAGETLRKAISSHGPAQQ